VKNRLQSLPFKCNLQRYTKVIANKLAVTKSGAWVLPYWGEVSSARGCHTSQSTVSGVLVSKDRGHTWKATGKVGRCKLNSIRPIA
jgi:hypothetical protein